MKLHLVPIRFRDASAFVAMWHRHNLPPVGCKFCIAVADEEGVLRGVAIIGRPVARMFDNGQTLEVNRTATDGTPNANSMLYAAAWRATKALGYTRLITYTQAEETGASIHVEIDASEITDVLADLGPDEGQFPHDATKRLVEILRASARRFGGDAS